MIRICFVCHANVCRSPVAEGVLQSLVHRAGLESEIAVESAGTHAVPGFTRDPRSQATALGHGIELHGYSRRFEPVDFDDCDYVIALDHENEQSLRALARKDPDRGRVHLLRNFDPESAPDSEVPDPYQGGIEGFENVYQMIATACRALLDQLRRDHEIARPPADP